MNFSRGRFHALFLKTVGQYNPRMAVKEAEYSVDVGSILDSALPDFLCPDQLLEIGGRDHLQVFKKAEHPCYLLGYLAGQRIEKILDGAFPVFCPVEDDRSVHGDMLTRMLTFVKGIVSNKGLKATFISSYPLPQTGHLINARCSK